MSGVKGAGEEQVRFGAPEHGEAIERVACEIAAGDYALVVEASGDHDATGTVSLAHY